MIPTGQKIPTSASFGVSATAMALHANSSSPAKPPSPFPKYFEMGRTHHHPAALDIAMAGALPMTYDKIYDSCGWPSLWLHLAGRRVAPKSRDLFLAPTPHQWDPQSLPPQQNLRVLASATLMGHAAVWKAVSPLSSLKSSSNTSGWRSKINIGSYHFKLSIEGSFLTLLYIIISVCVTHIHIHIYIQLCVCTHGVPHAFGRFRC